MYLKSIKFVIFPIKTEFENCLMDIYISHSASIEELKNKIFNVFVKFSKFKRVLEENWEHVRIHKVIKGEVEQFQFKMEEYELKG